MAEEAKEDFGLPEWQPETTDGTRRASPLRDFKAQIVFHASGLTTVVVSRYNKSSRAAGEGERGSSS